MVAVLFSSLSANEVDQIEKPCKFSASGETLIGSEPGRLRSDLLSSSLETIKDSDQGMIKFTSF